MQNDSQRLRGKPNRILYKKIIVEILFNPQNKTIRDQLEKIFFDADQCKKKLAKLRLNMHLTSKNIQSLEYQIEKKNYKIKLWLKNNLGKIDAGLCHDLKAFVRTLISSSSQWSPDIKLLHHLHASITKAISILDIFILYDQLKTYILAFNERKYLLDIQSKNFLPIPLFSPPF